MKTYNSREKGRLAASHKAQGKHAAKSTASQAPEVTSQASEKRSRRRRIRYPEEHIGSWWEGLALSQIFRYGRRFTFTRYVIETLNGNNWEAIPEESPEANVARARIEVCRIREGREPDGSLRLPENLWHGKPVRCQLQTTGVDYYTALHLVREKVLFPAIGSAIPRCMSADLYASVTTKTSGSLEGPDALEELHVVGASPVTIPPGFRLSRRAVGVMERK